MICKWCGGSVAAGEARCRSCGREIPALSDCGGFYDLTGGMRPGGAPVRQEVRVDLTGIQEDMKRIAGRSRKWLNSLRLVMLICFFILFALLIVLLIQVGSLRGQVADLREAYSAEQTGPTDQTNQTAPTDETQPEETTEPSETGEDTLSLPGVKVTYNSNELKSTVTAETGEQTGVSRYVAAFRDQESFGSVTLEVSPGALAGETVLTLRYESAQQLPDEEASQTCRWEYWNSAEEVWKPLASETGEEFTDSQITIGELLRAGLGEQVLKIRCTLTRTDASGALTVQITDIII